jgi:uncharacterized protein (TIGR02284 family)
MVTSNEKAISALNELIETAKDGQKGFSEAANEVKDAELKTLFNQYAMERQQFVDDLQSQVIALGGKPETSGSVAGAAHRGWIDIKGAVTGKDDHAILEECERGEDIAKDAYKQAVDSNDLPGTILPMVQRQYEKVQQAHDRVRDLRDGVRIA